MTIRVTRLFDYCTLDKMDHTKYSLTFFVILSSCTMFICAQTTPSTIKCRNITAIENFDIKQYMGVWYEYERYDIMAEDDANCIMLNYTLLPDMSFRINNSFVKGNKNMTMSTTVREANVTSHAGILKVQIPMANQEATVIIIATDYTAFSILWGCLERNGTIPMEFAWVISRNKNLSPEKIQQVNKILQDNNMNTKSFVRTKYDPITCWDTKSQASITNTSILLLIFAVILKYFI